MWPAGNNLATHKQVEATSKKKKKKTVRMIIMILNHLISSASHASVSAQIFFCWALAEDQSHQTQKLTHY
jgi:hypothetical protein